MGGESSGGSSDSTVRKAEQRRAMQRTIAAAEAKERQRKQEEMAMLAQEEETGKSLFARSATSGSIIRSASSGRGVTNRAGRQAREDYRAAYEGRPARNMDAEFPMDTGGDQPMEQVSGQPKLEPEKKATGGPSRASRRLLAQGQMGAKTRQFY